MITVLCTSRFVGVDSVALCEDGKWLSKYEKFLNPYDGGTDTGTTFKSVNAGTAQRSPITRCVQHYKLSIFAYIV